ncbi:MAG TPA: ChaN family lipoprotein, partial [archaeon]|nr:ChaN family lipoprotein [archaeon]
MAVSTKAVDVHTLADLTAVIPQLAEDRVVFVGEVHTDYAHHLTQLAIIRGIHERRPDLAIGMECFQQPFQAYLDEYGAGKLTETELLAKTQYFKRWGYDFRLYEPILKYARDNGIPLVALNVSSEIVQKVARSGLAGLTEKERAEIPQDLDRSSSAYRHFLQSVFKDHPHVKDASFETFYEAQLLWDEGMAARAARYLDDHPNRALVVLAGMDHVQYGFGIPDRLSRRIQVSRAIVLNGFHGPFKPNMADFVLLAETENLPPKGRLGVVVELDRRGLRIGGFGADSAAQAAGLQRGDEIVSVNDEQVKDVTDMELVMWDKRPDNRVKVEV